MEQLNTATREVAAKERRRIPMAVPVQKLDAPEIPGYHLHWFLGTPERIQRAQDGGYETVSQEEIRLNSTGLGSNSTTSGNTDMGSLVSKEAGSEIGRDGQPIRMVLMKIKLEWYKEDQKLVDDKNYQVANSLTGGLLGAERDGPGDTDKRYVGSSTKIPDFFNPHKKRPGAST